MKPLLLTLILTAGAYAQTGRTVSITWTASTSPGVTGNNVYRATGACAAATASQFTKINANPVAANNYDDISMPSYGDYCYLVRAAAGAFESPDSNKADAAVRPKAPTGLNGTLAFVIRDKDGIVLASLDLAKVPINIDWPKQ